MSFWKSTLKIFLPKPVRMEIRNSHGREVLIGDIDSIGDYSCALRKTDGSLVTVAYDEILTLVEVRV